MQVDTGASAAGRRAGLLLLRHRGERHRRGRSEQQDSGKFHPDDPSWRLSLLVVVTAARAGAPLPPRKTARDCNGVVRLRHPAGRRAAAGSTRCVYSTGPWQPLPNRPSVPDAPLRRFQHLRRHRRPETRRQRRPDPAAPAADQGRAGHGQDHAGRGSRHGAGHAAAGVAHQVDHQGAAGPVRVRRGVAPARFAARRRARAGHRQLHRQGRAVAGLRLRPSRRCC